LRGVGRFFKDYGFILLLLIAGMIVYQSLFPKKPQLQDVAPEFSLVRLDGSAFRLEEYKDRRVVLNFWASWCGPCLSEIPELAAVYRDHPDVVFLGIAVDSGTGEALEKTVARMAIPYPVAAADAQVQRAYDISVLPTTVVLAPEGKVVKVFVGAIGRQQLEAILR
jgi:thiol-disulfide isomerase/thioredoxin